MPLWLPLPKLPSSLLAWYEGAGNAERFREITKDPVFRQGLAILLERARPSQAGAMAPNVDASAALGWYAGYCDAIADVMTKLTDPKQAAELKRKAMKHSQTGGGHDADPFGDEIPWGHIRSPYDMSNLPDIPSPSILSE